MAPDASDALVIFSEQQVVSLVSTQYTVIAHLDLSYIRLGSLYLAREGSHLRCSINDAGLWMTHVDTKAMERFPTADATLGINSRHHAGWVTYWTACMTSAPLLKVCGSSLLPGSKQALILAARLRNSRIRHWSIKAKLREMCTGLVKKKNLSLS